MEKDTYGEVYYCSEEATIYLNDYIKSENELIYIDIYSKLNKLSDYLILQTNFNVKNLDKTYYQIV